MSFNTGHLQRITDTLEQALTALAKTRPDDGVNYDLYRNAAVKSFELSLETTGKLLCKALVAFGTTPRAADALVFNNEMRHAAKHGLLDQNGVERWLAYRANRNQTADDYGAGFANQTLTLLPPFLAETWTWCCAIRSN